MSKKGFTLIELIVEIAIIGILASTILVSMQRAGERRIDEQTSEQTSRW